MSERRYLHMRNWRRHQNYRRPSPTYINNFTSLLHDEDYLSLSGPQRALIHGLWLKYAETNGKVPENTKWLSQQLGLRVTEKTLAALNHAGWTYTASTHGWQDEHETLPPVAAPEAKAETETKEPPKEEPLLANQEPESQFAKPPYLNNIAGDIGARITSLEQARERRTA